MPVMSGGSVVARHETPIEAARRYVRECELCVEEQQKLIAKLKAAKRATQEANETLADLLEILRMERAHLAYVQSFELH
jgi:hypothetical protein